MIDPLYLMTLGLCAIFCYLFYGLGKNVGIQNTKEFYKTSMRIQEHHYKDEIERLKEFRGLTSKVIK